jgi:hypothetical protein
VLLQQRIRKESMADRWRGDPIVVGGGTLDGAAPVKLRKRRGTKPAPTLAETSAAFIQQHPELHPSTDPPVGNGGLPAEEHEVVGGG